MSENKQNILVYDMMYNGIQHQSIQYKSNKKYTLSTKITTQ